MDKSHNSSIYAAERLLLCSELYNHCRLRAFIVVVVLGFFVALGMECRALCVRCATEPYPQSYSLSFKHFLFLFAGSGTRD